MDSTRWEKLENLFAEALQIPENRRDNYIQQACGNDDELRHELTRLLAAEIRADAFMSRMETSANRLVWEPFQSGDIVSNYTIEEEIGTGGMGSVYKARDQRLDRPVALKFLHVHRSENKADKERFKREARAASRLTHDNICTIYEIAETDAGMMYIAMAYCDGRSLDDRLGDSGVTPMEALSITQQLASALNEAHRGGILHRDLKPANLIIDEKGRVKLVDFGIAKILGDDITATSAGYGTAAYMAPEQFGREPIDHRCDIWATGCLLYEMLTGRRPFLGESPAEIMYSVLHQHFPMPRTLRPELPDDVDDLIGRCLARNPSERFNSAQELHDALLSLQDIIATLSLSAPTATLDTTTVERKYVTALYYRLETNDQQHSSRLPDLVSRICHHYGGFMLHAAGDEGAMLLGYPVAEEQASEKAVRCGLHLLSEANEAGIVIALGAHAGFLLSDTGQPINRERLSDEHPVRSAARLSELAKPGCLLINDRLELQVNNQFTLRPYGKAFNVINGSDRHDRFAASDTSRITPLSGRFHELGILLDAWERVQDHDGQVISISGEPGIGKSRMVHELKKAVQEQSQAQLIECLCAPYQRNTALYPVIAGLEALLGWDIHTQLEERRERVEAFAQSRELNPEQQALLHVLLKTGHPTPGLSGETVRQDTLLLLEKLLLHTDADTPLVLIFEDLHWADPTTIDLLNLIIEKGPVTRVFLVCTYRPQFQPRWHGRAYIANISLNRLGKRDTVQMAKSLFSGQHAPPELIESVVNRTDGVPLFIEELTQAVLDRLPEPAARHTDSIIPLTLQESLQARLDALGVAKNLAQLAAVIGRDFSNNQLLAFARPVDAAEFEKQLGTLVRSQLIYQSGSSNDAQYRFKHALIRDAAYQSLTVENRRQLHHTLATTLLESFPQLAAEHPEVLAQHFTEAGDKLPAAQYWLQAGQAALKQYAIVEATAHSTQGLQQLEALPESPERLQLELMLQTTLGPALMAFKGYANAEVDKAYSRAREICHMLGDPPSIFPVLYGLWTVHCVRGLHPLAAERARQLMAIAVPAKDSSLLVAGQLASGITHTFRGQLLEAREAYQQGFAHYDFDMAQNHILNYGQDSGASLYAFHTINEWLLGNTELADSLAQQAIDHGRRSEHPQSMAFGITFAGWHAINRGQWALAGERLGEAINLCAKHSVHIFLALASVLNAIRLVFQGDPNANIDTIHQAIDDYTATGAGLFIPGWRILLAQVLTSQGEVSNARKELAEARAIVEANDEQWCLAEIERIDGELSLIEGDQETAQKHFLMALEIARQQQATAWQLRAETSLEKLELP